MSQFPHPPDIQVGTQRVAPGLVVELLGEHISRARQQRIAEVVAQRTYSVVSVCDDLFDTGNMAAVMRSAEAMGIQEVHSVQLQARYRRSKRTTAGADKWLDVHIWEQERASCIAQLKQRGYRIVVTQLAEDAVGIEELDFASTPTAIVFGNERDGVSPEFLEASDVRCVLPMLGFAQSYNISVAAAVSFYHIRQDRLRRQGHHGDLSEAEREWLSANFLMRSLDRAELLLKGLLERADEGAQHAELP